LDVNETSYASQNALMDSFVSSVELMDSFVPTENTGFFRLKHTA
jgi:hypothetical protein